MPVLFNCNFRLQNFRKSVYYSYIELRAAPVSSSVTRSLPSINTVILNFSFNLVEIKLIL